jgi:hypothetical protein
MEDFSFLRKSESYPHFVNYFRSAIGADRRKGFEIMGDDEYRAAVAAFIHAIGITRCPTACALPTQGTVAAADRAALRDYAIARDQSRQKRLAAREQLLGTLQGAG